MDFILESTDFNKVKVDIYEQCNEGNITEEEKQALLEAVMIKEINEGLMMEAVALDMAAMAKVVGLTAGGVAAAGAITLLIMKVASMLKTRDKIKASTELTAVNNDIKKCKTSLAKLHQDLSATIRAYNREVNDANQRADFYGSRTIAQNSMQYNYSTGQSDVVRTWQHNPQYDSAKAAEEKQKAATINKLVKEYMQKRDAVNKELVNLRHLKSKFMAVVRNNLEATEYQSIRDELDRIMANIEQNT